MLSKAEKNLVIASVLIIISVSPLVFSGLKELLHFDFAIPSMDLSILWTPMIIFWIAGLAGIIFIFKSIMLLRRHEQNEQNEV